MGLNLHDFGLSSKFLDLTPKAQTNKEKNRQTGLHQNENVFTLKNTIKRLKK